MVSVSEAQHIILGNVKPLPVSRIPLSKAAGRILREDVKSDRDQPPFNKCLMDGIAINSRQGGRVFAVETTIAAGDKPYTLKDARHCVKIMTGAAVPQGCDCVIPVEQVNIEGATASLRDYAVFRPKQFIRFQGSDARKGQVLVKAGTQLLAVQIGILASVGKTHVKVAALPKVAVVATGDELVEIHKPLKAYQTRLSNSYALKALIECAGFGAVEMFHLKDQKAVMRKALTKILNAFDVIIISGGVSMGDFDHVPQVLNELRVKQLFHKVNQRPGKPFWFGLTKQKKPVFALPGNPVSTLICGYRYVVPFLAKSIGLKSQPGQIKLNEHVHADPDLTHFLPVKDGKLVTTGGSGDFAALAQADGFIEYDHDRQMPLRPYFSWRV